MSANVNLEITADERKAIKSIQKMQSQLKRVTAEQQRLNAATKKKSTLLGKANSGLATMAARYGPIAAAASGVLTVWNDIIAKQKESLELNNRGERSLRSLAQIATSQEDFSGLRRSAQELSVATGRSVQESAGAIFQLRSTNNLTPETMRAIGMFASVSGGNESLTQVATAIGTVQGAFGRELSSEQILGTLLRGAGSGKFSAAELAQGAAKSGKDVQQRIGASFAELASVLGADQALASVDIGAEGLRALATEVQKKFPDIARQRLGLVGSVQALQQRGIGVEQLGEGAGRGFQTVTSFMQSGLPVVDAGTALRDTFGNLDRRAAIELETERIRMATEVAQANNANVRIERIAAASSLAAETSEGFVESAFSNTFAAFIDNDNFIGGAARSIAGAISGDGVGQRTNTMLDVMPLLQDIANNTRQNAQTKPSLGTVHEEQ